MPKVLGIIDRHLPLTIHHPSPQFLPSFKTMLVFIIIISRPISLCNNQLCGN